jgi:hypothetical protein
MTNNTNIFHYVPNPGNKNNKNSKNLTDYWSLRYNKEKEDEQIFFLKKQNLSEIKKLIDDTLTRREKGKFLNHEKYYLKEEQKEIKNKEFLINRDRKIKEQEKIEKEIDIINKRKKEKEFNEKFLKQKIKEELKEKNIIETQKKFLEKQKKWESKNFEHLTKVENLYQEKHNLAVNEYLLILRKGLERHERIEERKNEMNLKSQIENKKRISLLINYKNKIIQEQNEQRKKLEKKYKNISEFYLKQKEKKKNIIITQRKKREEKALSNIYKRIFNKNKEIERRKRLLDLFEKHEENVENNNIKKEKQNEQFKLNNLLKSDETTENYIRNINLMKQRNIIKMEKMRNKDIEVNNKKLNRQNSAIIRIKRYDSIRADKNSILDHAKQILEERKEHNPQDVYRKVFTNEEIYMLNE